MRRSIIFLICVGIFIGMFTAGTYVQVSEEDAKIIHEEIKSIGFTNSTGTIQVKDSISVDIAVHNIIAMLPMFIPGVGMLWGIVVSFSTGMAFSAISQINMAQFGALTVPPQVLFLFPHGLMELGAYSLAMSRSCRLGYHVIKDKTNKKEYLRSQLKPTLIEVGIAIGLLVAGGVIEAVTIQLAGDLL